MTDTDRGSEPVALIVVRAGAVDRFAALRAAFAPEGVEVVWDRRVGERRRSSEPGGAGSERRGRDRPAAAPTVAARRPVCAARCASPRSKSRPW